MHHFSLHLLALLVFDLIIPIASYANPPPETVLSQPYQTNACLWVTRVDISEKVETAKQVTQTARHSSSNLRHKHPSCISMGRPGYAVGAYLVLLLPAFPAAAALFLGLGLGLAGFGVY